MPVDIGHLLLVGIAPSLIVLAAGICRATWMWLRELVFLSRAEPRVRRSRV